MITITFDYVNIFSMLLIGGGAIFVCFMLILPILWQRNELVRLLDKCPVQNQSMKNLALNLGLKNAVNAIKKLK